MNKLIYNRFIARGIAGAYLLFALVFLRGDISLCQVETVPVDNQVYEFLNRMAVRGIIPLYSNAMIPLSRGEVAAHLSGISAQTGKLTSAEADYLNKFRREFAHEIDPAAEDNAVLLREPVFSGILSDKEKYLYQFNDSILTFYGEFLGSIENRQGAGGTHRGSNAVLGEIGCRLRGTVKDRLGYYFRATNGKLFGDRWMALTDRRLRSNVKFNDLNSSYFDFVEAYIRADLGPLDIQFGREHARVGTGYSDRLLLSDNAPVFDALKLDFHHKWFRFTFLHGSLVSDSTISAGPELNKYFAMHRAQFSIGNFANIGLSEMVIYQRQSMELAYLNPVNFYKSSEHSLKDRDNALVSADAEIFPFKNWKFYGTWLIDDIDFSRMGTGWWGNEFGWQGGVYLAEAAGISDFDAVVEYTRLEPYLYSNRLAGNNYTHRNIGLGHRLNPNSDEWLLELSFRQSGRMRTWLGFAYERHGENLYYYGDPVEGPEDYFINYGGDILVGHSDNDSETARFLDGVLKKTVRIQARVVIEPVTNIFISGLFEWSHSNRDATPSEGPSETSDALAALRLFIEY